MRLSTWLWAIVGIAFVLTIGRDEVGRVGLIIFIAGVCLIATALTAIMALCRTVGSFGEARNLAEHCQAIAETALVLVVGTATTIGVIFAGAKLVTWAIP